VSIGHLTDARVVVQTAKFGDVHIVTASGELDFYGAGSLEAELHRIGAEHAPNVIVDLLAVPFVDSTALGVLVGTAKQVRARGGRLALVCDDPRTLRVFQVTGLDGIFVLERSLSAAIDAAIASSSGESP
jgi:anti-sigma B factor antagonist